MSGPGMANFKRNRKLAVLQQKEARHVKQIVDPSKNFYRPQVKQGAKFYQSQVFGQRLRDSQSTR